MGEAWLSWEYGSYAVNADARSRLELTGRAGRAGDAVTGAERVSAPRSSRSRWPEWQFVFSQPPSALLGTSATGHALSSRTALSHRHYSSQVSGLCPSTCHASFPASGALAQRRPSEQSAGQHARGRHADCSQPDNISWQPGSTGEVAPSSPEVIKS